MRSLDDMEAHVEAVRQFLAGLRATDLSGSDAARVVAFGAEVERLGASMRTRFALRVTTTRAYEGSGHKSAADWLAHVSGEPVGKARGVLETAGHLSDAPEVDRAFAAGRLSFAQARVAAEAGALDPGAQGELVETAAGPDSFRMLLDRAARVRRRHDGEATLAEREARAHRGRYLRTWQPQEGGLRLEAWLPTVEGARVRSVLDREADRIFVEARRAGRREAPDRYLADALVQVVSGNSGERPTAQVALRVDAGALRRGSVEGEEVCEIPGIGPVPVAAARDLMGDALFHVVLTDGADVRAVTSHSRTVPASLRSALLERDRTCAVPGCTASRHLEIDHMVDFAIGGPTELANTVRLCRPHHAMKTYEGYRLVGRPGAWRWIGPGQRGSPSGEVVGESEKWEPD
jgi:hypothetical protein